jgi:hypothetical protein
MVAGKHSKDIKVSVCPLEIVWQCKIYIHIFRFFFIALYVISFYRVKAVDVILVSVERI